MFITRRKAHKGLGKSRLKAVRMDVEEDLKSNKGKRSDMMPSGLRQCIRSLFMHGDCS